MRKRLRKKLRKGEFKELGFEVVVDLREDMTDKASDLLWEDMVDFVEARNLGFGGVSGNERLEYSISVLHGRGSVTPEQREEVLAWLEARDEVTEVRGSQLFDVYHPPKTVPY